MDVHEASTRNEKMLCFVLFFECNIQSLLTVQKI